MVIKASGIPFDELTPETMVVCDFYGMVVEGDSRRFQRRRHARLRLPRARRTSAASRTPTARYATAWAARGEPIPCVLTAMADEFGGQIPVGPFALIGDEEIGRGIVETLAEHRSPAVLMRNHGVFTIGATPRDAIKAAVMCEDVARTVHLARALGDAHPTDRERRSMPSMTATRTSTASAEAGRQPGRGSACSAIMQELYDEMLPGITRAPGGVRARGRRGARAPWTCTSPCPRVNRADIERALREFERRGLDGLLVVMLTYGPGMRVARALGGDAAAGLPRQHPAGPGGHRRVGHGAT